MGTRERDETPNARTERPLNVALLEDELDLQDLLVEVLRIHFGERLGELFTSTTYEAFHRVMETGEFMPDVIVSDLNLKDTPVPVDQLADRLAQDRRNTTFLLMTGEVEAGARTLAGRRSVRFERLDKPFSIPAFRLVLDAMRLHVDEGYTEGEISQDDLEAQTEEPAFLEPMSSFPNLADFMRSVPRNPSKLVAYPGRFDQLVLQLSSALKELGEAIGGSYDDFLEAWNAFFPLQKRLSLLGMLDDHPGADFVLDFCIHDIQNKLAYMGLLQNGERFKAWGRYRSDIIRILAPAHHAFQSYADTSNEHVFWAEQSLAHSIATYSRHYSNVQVDLSGQTDFAVDAPAGALLSTWETFVSNAQKVSRGGVPARLELDVRREGDVLTARIFDDLKPFETLQIPKLFDEVLASERGRWGMGTGLLRLGQLMRLIWAERGQVDGIEPIESYHRKGGVWVRKNPGYAPKPVRLSDSDAPDWASKFFVLRFPRAS